MKHAKRDQQVTWCEDDEAAIRKAWHRNQRLVDSLLADDIDQPWGAARTLDTATIMAWRSRIEDAHRVTIPDTVGEMLS